MRETIMLLYYNDTDNDIMLYVYNFDLHLHLQYTWCSYNHLTEYSMLCSYAVIAVMLV